MKKLILIIAILFTINSCCKKEDPITYCNVGNPLEDLDWLKEKYDPTEYSIDTNSMNYDNRIYYRKYYDGSEYIIIQSGTISATFDCSGTYICESGGFTGGNCLNIFRGKQLKEFKTLAPQ